MTFRSASLIDGARVESAILRIGQYMAGGRYEGVATSGSLKVRQLQVPGNGVRIDGGAGFVVNRYQSSPDEAYPVSNLGETIIGSSQMPPQNAANLSHLVVVTVGDPEFSQAGHPWMPAVIPAGEEETFQYVRPWIVQNVPAGTKRFSDLGLFYPAYALARLDIPGGTTTITDAMIHDLREIPFPRSVERIEHLGGPTESNLLNGQGGTPGSYENWPNTVIYSLDIPQWANRAHITGFVEGVRLKKAGTGKIRVQLGSVGVTTETNIDEAAPASGAGANGERRSYNLGGEIAIPQQYRGTTVNVRVEATPNNTASKGFLEALSSSSGQIRVVLSERAD